MGRFFETFYKENFRTFCDGTSLHGFNELYHARNVFLKLFWLILVTAAVGLTTYQVIRSINQFNEQSTNTKNEYLPYNDFYPPIKVCYMHWVYWLDWEKAFSMKFTKETVLYGMSFLTQIYASSYASDSQTVKAQFRATMALNNITKMHQFYKSVAKPLPVMFTSMNSVKPFDLVEVQYSNFWGPLMCYSTTAELILETLNNNGTPSSDIKAILERQQYSANVTVQEYNWYMWQWLMNTDLYNENNNWQEKDLTNFTLPYLLYVDGYSQDYIPINDDTDFYTIVVAVSVIRGRPTPMYNYNCLVGKRGIVSNTMFYDRCNAKYPEQICKCNYLNTAILTDTDIPERICQNQIYVISVTDYTLKPILPENDTLITSNNSNTCTINETAKTLQEQCENDIVYPCEQWKYSTSSLFEKFSSEFIRNYFTKLGIGMRIIYPTRGIFIMVEVEKQTWEDFIAVIGGLLGIWTGASIISFVQFFYLCCFSQMESNCWSSRKKNDSVIKAEQCFDQNVLKTQTKIIT